MRGFAEALKRAAYAAADVSQLDRLLLLFLKRDHLRILTYHGVCPDEYREEGWMPSSFVTESEFGAQMELLATRMRPVRLNDAVDAMRRGQRLPDRSVAVTFDDGYANNISSALPILKTFGIPATIFLSTNSMSDQQLFPFDKLRLLKFLVAENREEARIIGSFPSHKRTSIECMAAWLEAYWPPCEHLVTEAQRRALQPLSWDSISSENSGLMDFGAHTHRHAILGNEERAVRRKEIAWSIDTVRARTGCQQIAFSYPNGTRQDFDDEDKRVVKGCGAICAVTQIAGANQPGADVYQLKRYPVGMFHRHSVFLAELCGLRTAIGSLHPS